MTIAETITLIISGFSLVLAIISFVKSNKSQKLQNQVNAIEVKLKEYELKEKEMQQQKQSCVEANIIHISKSNYKIKIWNSGNAVAHNVSASWNIQKGIILFDKDKMPFETLEPQRGFELSISTYNGAPGKLCITTKWEDENGKEHSKEQWCDM